jgi:NADH:ubiquinone oxidoreductase subunit 2 (subunit N)
LIFILIYFLFKLGVGPFYTWTVEVYNSCPTSTLFVVSTLPKLVYIPVLFFILYCNFFDYVNFWGILLFAFGLLTIFIGAFGILLTDKLKEIYAWSSVVHTGNILVIFSCISTVSLTFVMFYLTSYYIISCGFILLILSLRNKITGRFIKVVSELNSISYLFGNIYFLAIIVLASASGFTPFLSFFMKFSVLYLVTYSYGLPFALIIGLLNVVGGIAYLRMLRNIIGFNVDNYSNRSNTQSNNFIDVQLNYNFALLFNLICALIIFSFFFYKDFIELFRAFEMMIYYNHSYGNDKFIYITANNICEIVYKIGQFMRITKWF